MAHFVSQQWSFFSLAGFQALLLGQNHLAGKTNYHNRDDVPTYFPCLGKRFSCLCLTGPEADFHSNFLIIYQIFIDTKTIYHIIKIVINYVE